MDKGKLTEKYSKLECNVNIILNKIPMTYYDRNNLQQLFEEMEYLFGKAIESTNLNSLDK